MFGLEEEDCWNLDCKQTDIPSSYNKWSGISMKTAAKHNLDKADWSHWNVELQAAMNRLTEGL